jgi:hypothetical protein
MRHRTALRPTQHAAAGAVLALGVLVARPALGQYGTPPGPDRYDLSVESTTYLRLFQRSLLPGAGGAQVNTDTVAPVYEYVSLRALDVDAPWAKDSIDVEVAGWGSAAVIDVERRSDADADRIVDGDITVAYVRHRIGPAYVRLGRQIVLAGVSRFSQLDGLSAGAHADFGLGLDAYGGFTVLPRWAERPGYYHLGSASDSLLRRPDAFPEPSRGDNWMLGSRLYYNHASLGGAGVSIHEQTENGAAGRQDVGVDVTLTPFSSLSLTGDAFIDRDSSELVEGRVELDVAPTPELDIAAEYRRVEPALLLSRQSVLSVFSTEGFDEAGGEIGYRATSRLRLGAGGWAQFFGGDDTGVRALLSTKVIPDDRRRLTLLVAFGRVSERDNGYWSGRAAIRWQFLDPAWLTAEHYTYLYDTPIREIESSNVESVNAEWAATPELRLMLGTSVVRSPYATLDAQTLVRVSYALDITPRRGAP